MANFSHNSVASTCTGSHVVGWSIAYDGPRQKKVEKLLSLVNELINLGVKADFKIIIATITHSQFTHSAGLIPELMAGIGWPEVCLGEMGPQSREKSTGAIHLFAMPAKDYGPGLNAYKLVLAKELKELKNTPPTAAEIAERQKKEELKLINLRRTGLVHIDSRVDDVIGTRMTEGRSVNMLIAHIRMKYGVDFNEVWPAGDAKEPPFEQRTFRQMKEFHAAWREGKVNV